MFEILKCIFSKLYITLKYRWSLFQDSEETIHSAEINDTSYERAACFHWDEANFSFIFEKQKIKMDESKYPIHEIFMKK